MMLYVLSRYALMMVIVSVLLHFWTPHKTNTASPNHQSKDTSSSSPSSSSSSSSSSLSSSSSYAYDFIVVGGGLAGLSASLEFVSLALNGTVLLVDKERKIGGNSAKASSGINAKTHELDKSFVGDITKSAGDLADSDLIQVLVDQSSAALSFLQTFNITLAKTSQLGGHSFERTHRNAKGPNVGFAIISALTKAAESNERITIETHAKVLSLTRDQSNKVSGVVYEQAGNQVTVSAACVVLCTGGFSASKNLLHNVGVSDSLPTTNGPWATGDGLKLAEDVGAALVHMEQVQIHPTGFVDPNDVDNDTKFLAPEALRGFGAILLNENGQRFVDELSTRDKVSSAIFEQPGKHAYLVLGQPGAERFGAAIKFYTFKKLLQSVSSVHDIAARISDNVDSDVIAAALMTYQHEMENGVDQFGKTVFGESFLHSDNGDKLSAYIAEVVPVVHYTMGGVRINMHGEALDKSGGIIERLYAAGEVSGGVHGRNRLGGNSLLECVVFGRIVAHSVLTTMSHLA